MSRKMIAIITATAIAFSGMSATTAQAGNNQLFNFIAGATILSIIASNANGTQVTVNTRNHNHIHRNNLPVKCLRKRFTNYGWKKFYSHQCLANKGYHGWHPHW